MASLLFSSPPPNLSSLLTPTFLRNPQLVPSVVSCRSLRSAKSPSLSVRSALAESDSPQSLDGGGGEGDDDEEDILPVLQELAESFDLPSGYLAQLPRDLRLDLNDAAFDLSNGPVLEECGRELGEVLLNLARAWEKGDTSTSNSIARQLPSFQSTLKGSVKSAFGGRLLSAGRRFQSMGQYGEGELQKIAKAMITTGKALSSSQPTVSDGKPKQETRMFKFGELQVALTSEKAYTGAAIAVVFGFLSSGLTRGIESVPESSLQYASDNALLLAKSLRGALLLAAYSSTVLSAFASVGLLLLARELSSASKEGEQ